MKNIENIRLGISGLFQNKLRTFLTMLGIVFGVGAVISMLSISEGAKQETLQQIELLGTNNIIINKINTDAESSSGTNSFSVGLNLEDVKAIKMINPYVVAIAPQMEAEKQITYKTIITKFNIVGTTPDYFQIYNSKLFQGKFLQNFHLNNYANVCVIGYGIKNTIFKFEDPLEKKIKIGEQWFEIIGIISNKPVSGTSNKSSGFKDFNNDIYIPLTVFQSKLGLTFEEKQKVTINRRGRINISSGNSDKIRYIDRKSLDRITIKISDSDQLREASFLTERILNRRHYGIKDYNIVLPEELLEQKQKTQRIFNIVMGAIAFISLIVGGIGIMNIMLANILERTKEIGIRRAVGARRTDILSQFLFESVVISVIGGILGIFLGVILTSMISLYAGWTTVISFFSVTLAFFVSAITGILFGFYPAKKAAEKNPIESLHYE